MPLPASWAMLYTASAMTPNGCPSSWLQDCSLALVSLLLLQCIQQASNLYAHQHKCLVCDPCPVLSGKFHCTLRCALFFNQTRSLICEASTVASTVDSHCVQCCLLVLICWYLETSITRSLLRYRQLSRRCQKCEVAPCGRLCSNGINFCHDCHCCHH